MLVVSRWSYTQHKVGLREHSDQKLRVGGLGGTYVGTAYNGIL